MELLPNNGNYNLENIVARILYIIIKQIILTSNSDVKEGLYSKGVKEEV